ncbi:MAG TPA: decaprenylphospho-beta-D-erythro-pentofuranosid-2-ulose 2-reductase [Acidimicrobiales bacterium]|nr:decaprenylphospho-beta-D-erythro-pentofuranosid-2-ulose 2-reductase [Acidimicrobiales bacterium]
MNDATSSPQSVLVLGATSDIARAITRRLVERRARRIVLAGRDRAGVERVAEEMREAGASDVTTVAFDAADVGSHREVIDKAFAGGDIDLAVVAFGALGDQSRDERTPEAAAALVTTNFTGAVSTGVALAERMREQGHGAIVVLSSVAGERARRSNFIYGSTKAGLDAFYQGLADSLVGSGVRVLVVRPGFVKTRMTEGMKPAPLSTTAEEVAEAVVRGLERGSGTIWVPGPLRAVMVVLRHLPRPVFRRLPI